MRRGVERDQAAGLRSLGGKEEPMWKSGPRTVFGRTPTFAVTSGKGGVGKTQMAANLSVAMAREGLRVLMLDADLGLASLDLALGLRPERDLRDVVRGDCPIEQVVLRGPCEVHLVPACPGRYDMANLGSVERRRLVSEVSRLAERFDVLVVDTGAGIGSNAVAFAASADEVLLVVTPDPSSLRDAYAMAKVLHRRGGVDRVQVVANQVRSEAEGFALFERLEGIVRQFLSLRLEYLGSVPRDEAVRGAVASGEPFVLGAEETAAARAVEAIARRLLPRSIGLREGALC